MTELEMFAKYTIENNGEWWELHSVINPQGIEFRLYKTLRKFILDDHYEYNTNPVYQIFRMDSGKRVEVTTDFNLACKMLDKYKNLSYIKK